MSNHMKLYPRFAGAAVRSMFSGGPLYLAWLAFLAAGFGVGVYAYSRQAIFGLSVTRHPLELLPPHLFRGTTPIDEMTKNVGRRVRMIGHAIAFKKVPVMKKGRTEWMKFLSLEDLTGTFEAILFPPCYRRFAEETLTAGPFLLTGRIEKDCGVCSLNVDHLEVVVADFSREEEQATPDQSRKR